MKILHISTSDKEGAGLCCIRIHNGLSNSGIQSKVLVLNKFSDNQEVYKFTQKNISPKLYRWIVKLIELISVKFKIPINRFRKYQFKLNSLRKENPEIYFTLPVSPYKLAMHPLVMEADIIHLHWVAGFINYFEFFQNIRKPIVWTPHDENIVLGGFHYSESKKKASKELIEFDNLIGGLKNKIIRNFANLHIVALSQELNSFFSKSPTLENKVIHTINNSVDHEIFKPFSKSAAREIFNLPQNKKIILFISAYLNDERKGFKVLLESIEKLESDDYLIFAVGGNKPETIGNENVHYAGLINDERLLSLAYSASDLFVIPSLQEAFAQTPLEAMACGLPIVAYPFSGTSELINENNGIRCKDFSAQSLSDAVLLAFKKKFKPEIIRKDVIERFSVKKISEKYLLVYKEIINAKS